MHVCVPHLQAGWTETVFWAAQRELGAGMDMLVLVVLQGVSCPLCSQRRANLPSRGFLTDHKAAVLPSKAEPATLGH